MSRATKVSVSIDGHRTSLSLEPEFWDAFRALCRSEGVRPSERLAELDRARDGNLSSAVRLWVLARLRVVARP
jgi:predicted DNA-binding ribbon-helix-helix protein